MPKLHILSGAKAGQVFELIGERVTLGRAPDNMICLPDELVSTYHATFIRDGTGYRLRDLNSTNDTCINGARIVEINLANEDRIRFGLVETRIELEVTAAPERVPPVLGAPPAVPPLLEPARKFGVLQWAGIGVGIAVMLLGLIVAVKVLESDRARTRQDSGAPAVSRPAAKQSPASKPLPPVVVPTPRAMPSNTVAVVTPKPVKDLSESTPTPPPVAANPPALLVAPATNASVEPIPQPVPASAPPPVPEPVTEPAVVVPPPSAPTPTNSPAKPVMPLARGPVVVKPNPYDGQGVMAAQTPLDQLVFGRLQRLGIQPASICSDAVFVRRVYLDVIGTLPTADEARAFLEDRNPNKRGALVDRLLERDEFADYWAMKWCDLLRVKSEFPINLWPNAVQTYHQWIRSCLKADRPYDRFARDLLTASGSNFREPPVNFYRAVQSKDPSSLAQAVALTFMGARAENWPKERLAGMAQFFAQVGYKSTAEWKEEIVFYDASKATNATTTAVFPDGTTVELSTGKDPRVVFANWLISPANPWFNRNIVNRVCSWLLGRGIIHEPDDSRPDNPPVNPELLTLLERELIANKYNLKSVYRLILKSRTYQLSAVPRSNDPRAEANFAFYPVRRLEAEVLIDAINQITGSTEKYSSPIPEPFTFIPEDQRSIALADGSISSPFLDLFGRSSRATGLEAERNNRPTAAQQLHLLNSSHIQRKIEQSAKLRALLQQTKGKPRGVVDGIYLTILSRYPTDEEIRVVREYAKAGDVNQRSGLDVAWALINSAEFQDRH